VPKSDGQFRKGDLHFHRQNGRPKGVPNKANKLIKDMIIGALHDAGGQEYLAKRAIDQPVAFMALLGRVLPLQITGEGGNPIAIDFKWADATPGQPIIEADEPLTIEADAD
jgi:hypothetical protein